MGPSDPFSDTATAAPPLSRPTDGPVRVQARTPEPPRPPGAGRNAVAVGAALGLAVGLLFVLLTPGQALLVIVLTALGAALGAIVKAAFGSGVDLEGAWRALRKR